MPFQDTMNTMFPTSNGLNAHTTEHYGEIGNCLTGWIEKIH